MGAEQEEVGAGAGVLEVGEGDVAVQVDEVPVVEASPADGFLVDAEAEGSDEVQRGSGSGAEAGDVAGVLWDLGLDQHDLQGELEGVSAEAAGHGERIPLWSLARQRSRGGGPPSRGNRRGQGTERLTQSLRGK